MDIRILKYFVTVVEEENILKASQVLHITQPTLSRQLMDLEKELNCKLFIRSNRKITLTSEGLFLYNKAKEIILLQAKTINALKILMKSSVAIYISAVQKQMLLNF